ncbi:YopX family protein [Clostridium sardiniense]|uniref:YopX family protein n=1 Tax=Clostridium sardiniense TaxID=29369 RepID=UPI0019587976|nr:YopX family protein [Clostridium sardiniense]MBM7835932.1 putative phage protein (TIGR01671 family) [Clostridium sardiniense]
MDRRIIFRGKGIDTDVWFYGGYTTEWNDEGEDNIYILDGFHAVPVKKETVGQYTGLKDKNGKEIYEGDILKYNHESVGELIRVVNYKYGMYGVEGGIIGIEGTVVTRKHIPFANILTYKYEVIGNIYENPELLK